MNHSYNFVDPNTHAHTEGIERLWGLVKWRNKHHRGTASAVFNNFAPRHKKKIGASLRGLSTENIGNRSS
jgi:cellulose synthase/poly-beta-1,6-N-acetylglucosamine synthase-like glycosyltransferase